MVSAFALNALDSKTKMKYLVSNFVDIDCNHHTEASFYLIKSKIITNPITAVILNKTYLPSKL